MSANLLREQQDIEYQESLQKDYLKDVLKRREIQRASVQTLIRTKVPEILESLFTPQQQRLLRLYKLQPTSLTDQERQFAEKALLRLSQLRAGSCYNLSANPDFKFLIPGVPVTFCTNIKDTAMQGLVNPELNLVDVYLKLPDGEMYRYPLDDNSVEAFLGQAYMSGLDLSKYPRLIPS